MKKDRADFHLCREKKTVIIINYRLQWMDKSKDLPKHINN